MERNNTLASQSTSRSSTPAGTSEDSHVIPDYSHNIRSWPTPRPPIRSYRSCQLSDMGPERGRSTIEPNKEAKGTEHGAEVAQSGNDVVDHIPVTKDNEEGNQRKSTSKRRNTVNDQNQNDNYVPQSAHPGSSNSSPTSSPKQSPKGKGKKLPPTPKRETQNGSVNSEIVSESAPSSNDCQLSKPGPILFLLSVFACIVVAVSYPYVYKYMSGTDNIEVIVRNKFQGVLNMLNHDKEISMKTFQQIKSAIESIKENNDTGSLIFAYGKSCSRAGLNDVQVFSIVDQIATVSAQYIRNQQNLRHLDIGVSNINSLGNEGDFVARYRDDLESKRVMVVKRLDRVSPQMAKAFHFYCDEYFPLVRRSAIFFTLDMRQCDYCSKITAGPNSEGIKESHSLKLISEVEKCLADKWQELPSEELKPLLARIVSIVIDLDS